MRLFVTEHYSFPLSNTLCLPLAVFRSVVFPSSVIRTSPGMWAVSLCSHHCYRPYLSSCCSELCTHPHMHVYSSGIPHLVCHSPPPPDKRPNLDHILPVFLIWTVKKTNWGKGSLLLHKNLNLSTMSARQKWSEAVLLCILLHLWAVNISNTAEKQKHSTVHNVTAPLITTVR